MLQNLRAVIRGLSKSRPFTPLVLVSLALGIGVTTAMFTALDSLLLRGLPVRRPEQLMLYKRTWPGGQQSRFSYPAYRFFREQSRTLEGIGGVSIPSRTRAQIGSEGRVQSSTTATVQLVTGGFFDVLGVKPLLGRAISPSDDRQPGQHAVAVVSYAYWRAAFARDDRVIGRTVTLNELPFTIIGVMPPEFHGVEPGSAPDLWVPTMMQPVTMNLPPLIELPTFNWLYLIARPKQGISRGEAVAEQALLQGQFNLQRAQQTASDAARRSILREQLQVIPAAGGLSRLSDSYRPALVMMMAATGVVLLISCLNLSMLALARMTNRIKEIAIRLAIGAQTLQVLFYLGLESFVLAVVGTAAGMLLGQSLLTCAARYIPADPTGLAIILDTSLSYRTVAFSAGVMAAVTILFTVVPAVRVSRIDVVRGLSNEVGRLVARAGGRSEPIRDLIVAAQVAASIVILMSGGLLLDTLRNLRGQEFGFESEHAMAFQVALPRAYGPAKVHEFSVRLLDRLMSLPEFGVATWGSPSLLSGYESRMLVTTGDRAVTNESQIESNSMAVAPNFFSAMKVGLVAGRPFGSQDTADSPPVAILSETAARTMFSGESPVGRRLRARTGDAPFGSPIEIVGVVKDIRFRDLRSAPTTLIYRPLAQQTLGLADGLVLKAWEDPAIADSLQREMRLVDPNAVLAETETIAQRIDRWTQRERVLASAAGFFGALALLLACLGVYGVTSMVVSDRRREIALRLAIGSSMRDVTWLFVRRALIVAMCGSMIGVPAAILISHILTSYFFNVRPLTSATVWVALTLALALPTVASWFAVRSEGHVEPASALRTT